MLLVKNCTFYACLFIERKHPPTLPNNVLERKPAFLNYKKGIFARGLTHDFGQKLELSSMSVFLEKTAGYSF